MAQGPKHEAGKLQGPRQKMLKLERQGALSKPWRRQRQGPTCIREQVNNDREASGSKTGPNRGETGLGRLAQAGRPSLFQARFAPPFDLGAHLFIASVSAGRHIHPFITEPPTRRRSTGRKPMAAASPQVANKMA
jgi:hypothetical protein